MSVSYLDDPLIAVLPEADRKLIGQVDEFTQIYFQDPKFDSSHDFNHVLRVVANALTILREQLRLKSTHDRSEYNVRIVILGALLHDVGDKKYISTQDQSVPLARQKLIDLGLAESEASIIQDLIDGVSYSSEIKAPEKVKVLIQHIPELAVVQDADRLDALGAIGIGRCFTFGGARHARTLGDSVQHFEDKLLKLQSMMKTEAGHSLAAERSERIKEFMQWWRAETTMSGPA